MKLHNHTVPPFTRIVAGVLGIAGLVAVALVMSEFVPAVLTPTAAMSRRHATQMVGGGLVVMVAIYWLLLKPAWTAKDIDVTDDEDGDTEPPPA